MSFDPRNVVPENRDSVEQLLRKKADSFTQENAAKASQAAGPLASWVIANVKYSKVLEKIRPLEEKQNKIKKLDYFFILKIYSKLKIFFI